MWTDETSCLRCPQDSTSSILISAHKPSSLSDSWLTRTSAPPGALPGLMLPTAKESLLLSGSKLAPPAPSAAAAACDDGPVATDLPPSTNCQVPEAAQQQHSAQHQPLEQRAPVYHTSTLSPASLQQEPAQKHESVPDHQPGSPPVSGASHPETTSQAGAAPPCRHLWLGNLNTRINKPTLQAISECFGPVEDLATFPGRYGFVNYVDAEDAAKAVAALDSTYQPAITASNKLIVRYRPPVSDGAAAGTAAARRQSAAEQDAAAGEVLPHRLHAFGFEADALRGQLRTSRHLCLSGLLANVTRQHLAAIFSRFGPTTDVAVQLGPGGRCDGNAMVSFEHLQDAYAAYLRLNKVVEPSLSGAGPLKVRFKAFPLGANKVPLTHADNAGPNPFKQPMAPLEGTAAPQRQLWLGNIPKNPNHSAIQQVFGHFGPLETVQTFPGKAFAGVKFVHAAHAAMALENLDGIVVPPITGDKPLQVHYQSSHLTANSSSETSPRQRSGEFSRQPSRSSSSSMGRLSPRFPASSMKAGQGADSYATALESVSLGAAASQPPSGDLGHVAESEDSGTDFEDSMPSVNLSNRLNPNNIHYDQSLAQQYKRMSKADKDMLWAHDRAINTMLMQQNRTFGGIPDLAALVSAAAAAQNPLGMALSCQAQVSSRSSAQRGSSAGPKLLHLPLDMPLQSQYGLHNPLQGTMGIHLAATYPPRPAMPVSQYLQPSLAIPNMSGAAHDLSVPPTVGLMAQLGPQHHTFPPPPPPPRLPVHTQPLNIHSPGDGTATAAGMMSADMAAALQQLALKDKFPANFVCPMTGNLMSDPVKAADGFVYDRTAISAFILERGTSPMTGQPLGSSSLVALDKLRAQILQYLARRLFPPLPPAKS